MIIRLNKYLTQESSIALESLFSSWGMSFRFYAWGTENFYLLNGNITPQMEKIIRAFDVVSEITDVRKPYKLASSEWRKHTTINEDGQPIGGGDFTLIAGPCAIENQRQIEAVADKLQDLGIHWMRGGAYKPRTSPYSFQGLGLEGLKMMHEVVRSKGIGIVTEILDVRDLDDILPLTSILQVGTRSMQNFTLLRELGRLKIPVLLKRGMSATVEEWLLSAEYILNEGNHQVILCERGIRSFDSATRNVLDLGSAVLVKSLSHLPVIADPSQGSGSRFIVGPLLKAAAAAGLDGAIIEIHPEPEKALSDGEQSLDLTEFEQLVNDTASILSSQGRAYAHRPKSINFTPLN